ncbi:MAG: SBBP repeat-containing protein [bacterium]|nr:SBBP repeat-containing protein [bacterium]
MKSKLFAAAVFLFFSFLVLSFFSFALAGQLVYSTYLGGSGNDVSYSIAVDTDGNIYIAGSTNSFNFPTTASAYTTSYSGSEDVFVTKLNAAGSALVYSTYLGGGGPEACYCLAVDKNGNSYITGETRSSDFPTTAGALDVTYNNSGDCFVSKLDSNGSALGYSTFLGEGIGDDVGWGITVDTVGNAYISGYTGSSTFPTTVGTFDTTFNGVYDIFVSKLNASGSALIYSTYVGGTSNDYAGSIVIDINGNAYITGRSRSPDFPTTPGAFDTTYTIGAYDVVVFKLNTSGSTLVYSSFLGGINSGIITFYCSR